MFIYRTNPDFSILVLCISSSRFLSLQLANFCFEVIYQNTFDTHWLLHYYFSKIFEFSGIFLKDKLMKVTYTSGISFLNLCFIFYCSFSHYHLVPLHSPPPHFRYFLLLSVSMARDCVCVRVCWHTHTRTVWEYFIDSCLKNILISEGQ